jgi:ABC-2 type transport system permease protein
VIAPTGSALWLLKHEVRLFLYNAGLHTKKGAAKRGLNKMSIAVWTAAALALHAFAFLILGKLDGAGSGAPQLVMAVTGILAAAMTMMLSTGLKSSVEVLFERGDLDLLLSSPLPSRSIFMVRLAGIVVGIAGIYLFFLAPFAHAGFILGQFRWLGIYPSILSMAAVTASLAMLMTLGLVRLLGVRRTRVVAQVLGALSGALFFLLSQLYSTVVRDIKEQAQTWLAPLLAPGAMFGPDSLFWLPGHAVLGSPWPLFVMSLLAVSTFFLTVHFTHGFFVHGVQQAVSMVRAAKRPAGVVRYRFSRRLTHVIVIKEWRLIARDPQLISQILLQLLYLLPLCALLFVKGSSSIPVIGAGLTFLCGSLTAALAWIIISAEDAPDLLLAAPCSQRTVRRAKLAAVAIPPLVLMVPPLFWTALHNPFAGLMMCAMVVASVQTAALIVLWWGRPSLRGDFKVRAKGNFLSNMFEVLNGFAWAGLAYLLLSGSLGAGTSTPMLLGAAVIFVTALVILALAWVGRRRAG